MYNIRMPVVPIVKIPNKVLTTKCEKVKLNDPELKGLVDDLVDSLEHAQNPQGAGLAAPQLGVLKRVLIARNFYEDPGNPNNTKYENVVLINPKIVSHSQETNIDWEGCLSIPDTYGKVQRYNQIKVRTEDMDGQEFTIKASGFFARIVQHEIDHLDGILFTSKLVGKKVTEHELDEIIAAEEE
jgi:peptide deformylase